MKTLKILSFGMLFIAIASVSFAQVKSETLKVSGECGMCKKKIEKAAKDAGASYALWDKDTKVLTLKYNSSSTNTAKIEKKIAAVGYDTPDFKATEEAYKKLDKCCQYERGTVKSGCADGCMKDGKCTDMSKCKDMDCCKKGSTSAMNCSKDSKNCCSKKAE